MQTFNVWSFEWDVGQLYLSWIVFNGLVFQHVGIPVLNIMDLSNYLDFVIVQLLQIKDANEEGQNTQADHLAFKTIEIEQKLSSENNSDEHDV